MSRKKWVVVPYKDGNQLAEIVQQTEQGTQKTPTVVVHFDMDELWASFVNQFKYVQAAGGMVFNGKGEFLVIYRNGRWDLPKGHLKKGERPEFGGMREVEEECGISGLSIVAPLENTFHMYERKGMVLKKTFWYLMRTDYSDDLVPQVEEGITEVTWKSKDDMKELAKKSYPIISKLIKKGVKKMRVNL